MVKHDIASLNIQMKCTLCVLVIPTLFVILTNNCNEMIILTTTLNVKKRCLHPVSLMWQAKSGKPSPLSSVAYRWPAGCVASSVRRTSPPPPPRCRPAAARAGRPRRGTCCAARRTRRLRTPRRQAGDRRRRPARCSGRRPPRRAAAACRRPGRVGRSTGDGGPPHVGASPRAGRCRGLARPPAPTPSCRPGRPSARRPL